MHFSTTLYISLRIFSSFYRLSCFSDFLLCDLLRCLLRDQCSGSSFAPFQISVHNKDSHNASYNEQENCTGFTDFPSTRTDMVAVDAISVWLWRRIFGQPVREMIIEIEVTPNLLDTGVCTK